VLMKPESETVLPVLQTRLEALSRSAG
jgi:hypothetical protein